MGAPTRPTPCPPREPRVGQDGPWIFPLAASNESKSVSPNPRGPWELSCGWGSRRGAWVIGTRWRQRCAFLAPEVIAERVIDGQRASQRVLARPGLRQGQEAAPRPGHYLEVEPWGHLESPSRIPSILVGPSAPRWLAWPRVPSGPGGAQACAFLPHVAQEPQP